MVRDGRVFGPVTAQNKYTLTFINIQTMQVDMIVPEDPGQPRDACGS